MAIWSRPDACSKGIKRQDELWSAKSELSEVSSGKSEVWNNAIVGWFVRAID